MKHEQAAGLADGATIDIYLVAHTNVGKTTLVRTLLGRDVGEVLDAPDVTRALTSFDLVADPQAGTLRLWDTPGFADSFRLAQRLGRKPAWVAWLVRELWDRRFNPGLWRGQRLALTLRRSASVILYPVSLLERPVDAVYVAPEMAILAWTGKPIIVIFNQGGSLANQAAESERADEWRAHFKGFGAVRRVLSLDAYTRCWLEELVLFDEIGRVLPESEQVRYEKLAAVLRKSYIERFDASTRAIAAYLYLLSHDSVELDAAWFDSLKQVWGALRARLPGSPNNDSHPPQELAMQELAQRYADRTKALTDELIAINRLGGGVSAADILEAAALEKTINAPVDGATSAVAGSVISGVITGLAADLIAGGLTLGTGTLIGGVVGALGAAALAKGYNLHSGRNKKVVRWSQASCLEALAKSVMLYLSIAHFGRGQGQWRQKAGPVAWRCAVDVSMARFNDRLQPLLVDVGKPLQAADTEAEWARVVRDVIDDVLLGLYAEEQR